MYLTTISIPVAYDADNDVEARRILDQLLNHLSIDVTLGALRTEHGAEIIDAPTAEALEESLPYEPLRAVPIMSHVVASFDSDNCDCFCHSDGAWRDPVCPQCFERHIDQPTALTVEEQTRARDMIADNAAVETTCDDCGAQVWNVNLGGMLTVDRNGAWHTCPSKESHPMFETLTTSLRADGWRDDESMALYEGDTCWTPPAAVDDSGCYLVILSTLDHTTDDGTFVPAGRITLQVEHPEADYPDNLTFTTWDNADAAIRGIGLAMLELTIARTQETCESLPLEHPAHARLARLIDDWRVLSA